MSIPPKGTPERSEYFRELVAKRWAKPRPAPRLREGARTFPAGSAEEMIWDARAREIGMSDEGMTRTAWRRLLKRLADADTARVSEAADEPSQVTDPDADLYLHYLEREVTRLRTRARRDREIADAHDQEANAAESRLVEEMRRLGLTS